jgi:group I intron endonuclease
MTPLYHSAQQPLPTSGGIYRITCTTTSKIYIGSALNLRKRLYEHFGTLRRNTHHNAALQRAFNKYGPDAFTFDILEFVLIPELLTAHEQFWFSKLRPFGKNGFNLDRVAGSSLGRVLSIETKGKIGTAHRGKPSPNLGKKMTPEQLEHHILVHTGKKASEETKRKQAEARKGTKRSPETREKMRLAALGHEVNEQTRAKIGEKSKGRVFSDEARTRMSMSGSSRTRTSEEYATRRKTLIATSPDGIEYVVHGVDQFCKEHSLDGSSLAKVAKGKYKHHHGWTARYPEADID